MTPISEGASPSKMRASFADMVQSELRSAETKKQS